MKRRSLLMALMGVLNPWVVRATFGASKDPIDAPAPISTRAQRSMLVAVTRTPGGSWVAVGRHGNVVLSKNGTNWAQVAAPSSVDLTSVCFSTATHGWAAGHGGVILATTDGGRSWTMQLDGRRA